MTNLYHSLTRNPAAVALPVVNDDGLDITLIDYISSSSAKSALI